MIFRRFTIKLRRHAPVICTCGLISCLAIVVILTLCSSLGEMNRPILAQRKLDKRVLQDVTVSGDHAVTLETNLLIVVMSSPTHSETRNVIRATWAKDLPNGATVRFVIGTLNLSNDVADNLHTEDIINKDLMLLEDLEESYEALTYKLLSTFTWASQHYKFNFLLKVDEDSFVRVDNILEELLTKPSERLYWGFFDGRAHVHKKGKWSETDFVLCDRYLPYALGGGYVISKDLVTYVATNGKLLKLFKSEDVSLGTWLGPLDINRIHEPNFDTEFKSRGCYNSYLITHKKSTQDMKQLYRNIHTLGHLCSTETRVRLSYQYNWDNLPTKCCERIDPTIP